VGDAGAERTILSQNDLEMKILDLVRYSRSHKSANIGDRNPRVLVPISVSKQQI
jgi:hypothetical protein